MLLLFQARLKLLPQSTLNKLSKPPRLLMLPQEIVPTLMLPMLLNQRSEPLELFKLAVMLVTTHTQLESNGLVNQQTDLFNILMDLIQFQFMRPTELIQIEIIWPLKPRDQLSLKNNKDGNLRVILITGPLKPLLVNKDGQMKLTHGQSHLLTDKMICQKPIKPIPVLFNSRIMKLTNLLFQLLLRPEQSLLLKMLSKQLRSQMSKLEMKLTSKKLMISKMLWIFTPCNLDGTFPTTIE